MPLGNRIKSQVYAKNKCNSVKYFAMSVYLRTFPKVFTIIGLTVLKEIWLVLLY